MSDWIRQAFADGLYGKLAHYDVLKALRGITSDEAKQQPFKKGHSIWDHLFHIVFWHDITKKAIQGQAIDWDAIKGTDWLPADAKLTQQSWNKLVDSFSQHLTELKELAETKDLSQPIKGFGDMPLGKGILVKIQHNSYHIGQIINLRQLQGNWPPPNDK
jgi:uncharacterized damage-inducible protein DinB